MKLHQSRIQNLIGRISLYKDWWKVTLPFNKIYNRTPEHFVTLRTGQVMHVRDIFGDDLPIIYEMYAQDVYHLHELKLPKNATVFDVGAHIGSFSVAIHTRFADAHITAFEPHPNNFIFLKKNAPFAQCVQAAVAGTEREVHLGDHRASSAYALSDSGITVQAVTLDSYIRKVSKVDLLKVDVEGAEKYIFEQLTPESLAKIDKIRMEIHPPHAKDWFVTLFEKADFIVQLKDDILFADRT